MNTRKPIDEVADQVFPQAAGDVSRSHARRIAEISGLKTFPEVARKVMHILGSQDFDINATMQMIKKDPSLASSILRLANSAFFSRGNPVASIDVAIVRLGRESVRNVVIALATMEMFPDVSGLGKAIRDHCAAVAAVSQMLGGNLPRASAEHMFLCGLMHDIGKLFLMESKEFDYSKMITTETLGPNRTHVEEGARLGFDHGILTGMIVEEWQIPGPASRVIALHHQPAVAYESDEIGPMVAVLRVADQIERFLQGEPTEEARDLMGELATSVDFRMAGLSAANILDFWGSLSRVRADSLAMFG